MWGQCTEPGVSGLNNLSMAFRSPQCGRGWYDARRLLEEGGSSHDEDTFGKDEDTQRFWRRAGAGLERWVALGSSMNMHLLSVVCD